MADAATILAQAFENRDRIRRIARRFLSEEARQVYDSEDLAATVYRRILESGAEAASEAQTWEFIRAVATHAAIDRTALEFVRHRRPAGNGTPEPGPGATGDSVSITAIINALPAHDQRQIVALRARAVPFKVIARVLGIPERTVFRRWQDARALLADKGYDLVE